MHSPQGAYSSITKINFKTLDYFLLKPIGVYGSREEIVRFLREMDAVDVETAPELLVPQRAYRARGAEPILRSGLYIIRTFPSTAEERTYVLYWPEDTTWDDDAISTVQCNRVMFMRYLTKLCDQLVCLLSTKHSQAIVWREEVDNPDNVSLDSEDDVCLFDFTVATTNEEANVIARQGFTMNSSHLVSQPPPPNMHIEPSILSPRLLYGETTQGFMTANFRPARATVEPFVHDNQSASQIRPLMSLVLSSRKRAEAWEERRIEIAQPFSEYPHPATSRDLFGPTFISVPISFRMLRRDGFSPDQDPPTQATPPAKRQDLFSMYPKAAQTFRGSIRAANLDKGIKSTDFQSKKERLLILYYLLENYGGLSADQTRALGDAVFVEWNKQKVLELLKSFAKEEQGGQFSAFGSVPWGSKKAVLSKEEAMWRSANNYATSISDSRFLSHVKKISASDYLHDAAVECEETAYDCLTTQLDSLVSGISQQILSTQNDECDRQVQREVKSEEEKELKVARAEFVQQIEDLCRERSRSRNSIYIDDFRTKKEDHLASDSYFIGGRKETLQYQEVEYKIHILRLLADQKHNLQLDPSYVPVPVLNERLSQSFRVPSETVVKYAHLLEGDRILLGLVDAQGNVMILLDRLSRIDATIQSRSYAKFFHPDKIGQTCLIAFDESMRMLAVYASTRMQLHIFVFDEELKSLRGLGTPIDLSPFYNPGASIVHACFVHKSEEILFVDSNTQATIFSLVTLRPKPSSLQLPQIPRAIYSTPDGSCVLVVQDEGGERTITAYHWSTFTATRGISVTLPDFPVDLDAALLTSIINRNNIHFIGIDLNSRTCRSVVLDITQKATEFTFQERRLKASSLHVNQAIHNCLIDCHGDVWTRFPVVPGASSSQRRQKTLIFVTDDYRRPFSSYFSHIVSTFEKTSRKPTGDELKSFVVSAQPFPSFTRQFLSSADWPGLALQSWRDGVASAQLEKSLLGAEVNRTVDNLSFGWYESIFQSYWASKPVKVVSSMGEQSVGKNFTLNHLVDTSFAASAMRTTDGVWMSVSAMEDGLIVALDFEGVHSLERSAQEDTLLVLFNTAISNIVLFRNNFAFSRDISDLFRSFQSSSSVLDPASNPSLFQSTLAVIIEDVIESDRVEVTREFALKIRKIVHDEQDANFITRLHAGKLQIIPWPVMESKDFYRMFSAVKKKLDQQRASHNTAGEFLHTLKTLMAKLKANDWGAISQNMATHRASSLLKVLPIALETGYSEVVPQLEPLKDFYTDLVMEAEDTEARFLLTGPAADREHRLEVLRDSWDRFGSRQQVVESEWIFDLAQHLTHLVDLRVAHVEKWLKSNMQRFQAEHASIEKLRRAFNSAVIDLRASIQLCKSKCATCNLFCTQSHLHEGDHDCLTSHECIHHCTFCNQELLAVRRCGQPRSRTKAATFVLCRSMYVGKYDSTSNGLLVLHLSMPLAMRFGQPAVAEREIIYVFKDMSRPNEHSCNALCSAPGICQVETTPLSVEATFTPRHEAFQYTKRRLVFSRSSTEDLTFIARKSSHSTFVRAGHSQQEHETRHGVMSRTRCVIDGAIDGNGLVLDRRKFSSKDDSAPMLCNLSCILPRTLSQAPTNLRTGSHTAFTGAAWVSKVTEATTLWDISRLSQLSVDPYSREDQVNFAKCDAVCPELNFNQQGLEHTIEVGGANAQPSHCMLPMFHPVANAPVASGIGYVSNDGHQFDCNNPMVATGIRPPLDTNMNDISAYSKRCQAPRTSGPPSYHSGAPRLIPDGLVEDVPLVISTSYGDDEQTGHVVSLLYSLRETYGGVGDGNPDPATRTQTCFTNDSKNQTKFIPVFPASCPFVTAVGGTVHIPEVAASFSGGGFSDYFERPNWQNRAVQSFLESLPKGAYAGLFNPAGRAIPDVSAQADLFRIFLKGSPVLIGGTSAAAPSFAAFVALLNDVRLTHGRPSLGFLNLLLYRLNGAGFNDITSENAPGCGTPGFNNQGSGGTHFEIGIDKLEISQTCLIAIGESKRMLTVYAPARMQLQIFVFDEELKSLGGLGTSIDLSPLYNPGASIMHARFVHKSEEILFVDSNAQATIFSLVTLRPKYHARSTLPQTDHVFSPPKMKVESV
ncbi:hypothetical protein EDB89DRAFT_1906886 [Lactarius sanguifluus]|nr:hypothetical protein EDB89DRAFT_1906886 [Lactarius sanguifluus]